MRRSDYLKYFSHLFIICLRFTNSAIVWGKTSAPNNTEYQMLASDISGRYLAALTKTTVYYSLDYGQTWSLSNASTFLCRSTSLYNYDACVITSSKNGQYVYIGSVGDLMRSSDYGITFESIKSNFPGVYPYNAITTDVLGQNVAIASGDIDVNGYENNQLWISNDYASTWTESSINSDYIGSITSDHNFTNLVAVVAKGDSSIRVIYSSDAGLTWKKSVSDFPRAKNSGSIHVTSDKSGQYVAISGINTPVYYSSDCGATWHNSSTTDFIDNRGLHSDQTGQYLISYGQKSGTVYASSDYGQTFDIINEFDGQIYDTVTTQNFTRHIVALTTGIFIGVSESTKTKRNSNNKLSGGIIAGIIFSILIFFAIIALVYYEQFLKGRKRLALLEEKRKAALIIVPSEEQSDRDSPRNVIIDTIAEFERYIHDVEVGGIESEESPDRKMLATRSAPLLKSDTKTDDYRTPARRSVSFGGMNTKSNNRHSSLVSLGQVNIQDDGKDADDDIVMEEKKEEDKKEDEEEEDDDDDDNFLGPRKLSLNQFEEGGDVDDDENLSQTKPMTLDEIYGNESSEDENSRNITFTIDYGMVLEVEEEDEEEEEEGGADEEDQYTSFTQEKQTEEDDTIRRQSSRDDVEIDFDDIY